MKYLKLFVLMVCTVFSLSISAEPDPVATYYLSPGETKKVYNNYMSSYNSDNGYNLRWELYNSDALTAVNWTDNYCVVRAEEMLQMLIGRLYLKWDYYYNGYKMTAVIRYDFKYKEPGVLELIASPSGGVIEKGTKVSLTAKYDGSTTNDVDIYYTLDGSQPDRNSPKYYSPITINESCTLNAWVIHWYQGWRITETYTVQSPDIKVTSITLNKSSLSLQTGQIETLTATVKPDNATDKTVSWTSSSTSVATVDNNGKVTAKAKGSATITCRANDGSGVQATCAVTVTDPNVPVTSITLNKSSLSLQAGQSETLTATVLPSNATNKTVTWTSSNTSIATVDANGKVTAVAAGSATITCKANDGSGKQATCAVTVSAPTPGYTDITQYSNIVYLEPATASPESTLTVPVKMKNPQTNISGFQFDLVLPTGVTVAKDEDDFYLIELSTDRTTVRKHMVSAQQQADGSIRVVCYSNSNSTFSGTSGNVLTMTLQVAADAPTGETSIKLRDVVMTTPALDSYNVPWVVSKLTIEDYIPGDVNGDKLVNVVDVAGVVNLILNSGNTAQLNRKAADINGDNNINVVDVAGVVNIILGGGANARMSAPRTAAGQSRIYIEDFSLEPGEEKTVSVNLSNPGDSFTGCQFDLYLPEGLTVAEEDGFPLIEIGSRTTARKHTVSATAQADGSLRVVCYSNNNYTFSGEDGEILTITFKAAGNAPSGKKTVWMRNITLSRPDVTGVSPDDTSAEVTIAGNTPQKLVLTASPSSGVVPRGTVVTISANVEGATIIYWVNDDPLTSALSPLVLTINENTEISAGAIKEGYENSDELRLYYTISDNSGINDITSEGKSNSVFSLSGQRLTVPRRGVNIVSGRKVVVR